MESCCCDEDDSDNGEKPAAAKRQVVVMKPNLNSVGTTRETEIGREDDKRCRAERLLLNVGVTTPRQEEPEDDELAGNVDVMNCRERRQSWWPEKCSGLLQGQLNRNRGRRWEERQSWHD